MTPAADVELLSEGEARRLQRLAGAELERLRLARLRAEQTLDVLRAEWRRQMAGRRQ